MNKRQRAYARIKNNKERKAVKTAARNEEYGDVNKIFTYSNMAKSAGKCKCGKFWQDQTKHMVMNMADKINETITPIIEDGEIRKLKFLKEVEITERGKSRSITPITIEDRVQQRCLCDCSLVPLIQNKIIYDNGASQKHKGVDFTRKRIDKFLNSAVSHYGRNFYVLQFDFTNFFGSIPHKLCYDVLLDLYGSEEMPKLVMQFVTQYQLKKAENELNAISKNKKLSREELDKIIADKKKLIESIKNYEGVGICLGSQISQMLAVIAPNKLDHYIKDKCGFRYYVRYMDDGIIIHNDKKKLNGLLSDMYKIVDELGLSFNEKKTHVVKVTKGFTFMQVKYFVDKNGKLVKNLSKSNITRMRRRLKKLHNKYTAGDITLDDVYASVQSWFDHAKIVPKSKSIRNIEALYDELFDGYKITKNYFKLKNEHPDDDRYKTQKELINEITPDKQESKYYHYFYQIIEDN